MLFDTTESEYLCTFITETRLFVKLFNILKGNKYTNIPVSYTHLDVYKRQVVHINQFFLLHIRYITFESTNFVIFVTP